MKPYLSLNLGTHLPLDVKINESWVPLSIFQKGKYKVELDDWMEDAAQGGDINDGLTQLLMLSEALGSNIRHYDEVAGVYYQVHFGIEEVTRLKSYTELGSEIKTLRSGAHIPEGFEPSLSHIIDI